MDVKFWAPMIATIIQVIIAIMSFRLQLRHMQLTLAPAKVQEVSKMPWYKTYWPIFVLCATMVGSWTPYFLFNETPKRSALLLWGPHAPTGSPWPPPMPGVAPEVDITVDGHLISSEKNSYHVAGVAFHAIGASDPDDIRDLSKSALHDIRDENIDVVIPLNQSYMEEFKNGYRGTSYRALLVPNGVRMEDFQTLREAYRLGVVEIGHGGGPP